MGRHASSGQDTVEEEVEGQSCWEADKSLIPNMSDPPL
jgi:hypothetical protein